MVLEVEGEGVSLDSYEVGLTLLMNGVLSRHVEGFLVGLIDLLSLFSLRNSSAF